MYSTFCVILYIDYLTDLHKKFHVASIYDTNVKYQINSGDSAIICFELMLITDNGCTQRTLFTKFLTPGLTHELCNPLDDWLDWLISTSHQADYIIRRLTRELKVWWIKAMERATAINVNFGFRGPQNV